MDTQVQCLMALVVARERVRDAEARARLRWGMEPEPPAGRRIAVRLASIVKTLRRPAPSRDRLRAAGRGQPSGGGMA